MYAIKKNKSGFRAIEENWSIDADEYKAETLDGIEIINHSANVSRITRAQGKKHLLALGKYAFVKSAIDSELSSDAMQIGFYDEEYWLINDPFVLAAAELLVWNSDRLQHEFNEAAKI